MTYKFFTTTLTSGDAGKDKFYIEYYGSEPLLFDAAERVALCKAIVYVSFKGHLSETGKPAPRKSQLLLMEFATDGVNKSIDKAIKTSPVISRERFDQLIGNLLRYRTA